jgi:Uma2 family endonuclease
MTLAVVKSAPSFVRPRIWSQDQLSDLLDLAEELRGRPIPGLQLTESEFENEYCDEDIRAEWIDGEVVIMAPPSGDHCDIGAWLLRLLSEFVENEDLGLVRPEFTVRFPSLRRRRGPDLLFISRPKLKKLQRTYFEGAPDLILEIVSPDSEARDWRHKYDEYEAAGVREYWIADPLGKNFEAYTLGRSKSYTQILPDGQNRVHSKVLKGLYIKPEWLFRTPLPKLSAVLKELKIR